MTLHWRTSEPVHWFVDLVEQFLYAALQNVKLPDGAYLRFDPRLMIWGVYHPQGGSVHWLFDDEDLAFTVL